MESMIESLLYRAISTGWAHIYWFHNGNYSGTEIIYFYIYEHVSSNKWDDSDESNEKGNTAHKEKNKYTESKRVNITNQDSWYKCKRKQLYDSNRNAISCFEILSDVEFNPIIHFIEHIWRPTNAHFVTTIIIIW